MGVDKQLIVGKGCLNKEKVCTARFPRKISKVTVVDKEGHIHLMKNEPNINTVNDVMVYCFGCNTDCSSLSSGTAVKATAGYIADYICKMGLKTYQIFPPYTMSSNEIQTCGPMAAMYLLGHPDHYSSHSFEKLYWRTYVVYVQNEWAAAEEASRAENPRSNDGAVDNSFPVPVGDDIDHEMEDVEPCFDDGGDEDEEDSVAIKRTYGRILSRSSVDDYMMRPEELTAVCLYDWIQCSVRKEGILYSSPIALLTMSEGCRLSSPTSSGLIYRDPMETIASTIVALLTLFVPWRSPLDLKSSCESWDAAFDRYSFSDRHLQIISNMNIRHECYDARDDYHAQLKLQVAAQYDKDADLDTEDEEEECPDDADVADVLDAVLLEESGIGVWSQKKLDQMKEVEAVMQSAGWTVDSVSSQTRSTEDSFAPDRMMGPNKWKSVVSAARKEVLDSRLVNAKGHILAHDDDVGSKDPAYDGVKVVNDARVLPGAYFLSEFELADADVQAQLTEAVTKYSLNEEQRRAFSIVARHSISVSPAPLLMYIGGMGGTGKTRVIDSLRYWFTIRSEANRMAVTAPTGAAASVVRGSTYHSYLGVATGDRRAYAPRGVELLTKLASE
ncbi:hypothetical protein D9611_013937 [Ephemerocybe angulata]|uniref:ATP-dependent DNA helicase n=1 Tax=Ephemerocybe angulata TaxID=980116 RepID=A0A8H5ARP1_9AGAR|nr:hypothetical protein D9611_013937 [Tulosesus angulatus]